MGMDVKMDREQYNARQRESRRANGNSITKRYEKTKKGFLMRLYRNMQSRVTGLVKGKKHLYLGLTILPREDFYEWAFSSPEFHALWLDWGEHERQRRWTPSVDRIDSSKGYSIENMEWVPFHENCRRGAVSRWSAATQ